jgi:Na+/H+ antiporter NhaD/arsenite permease-like protein
MRPPPLASATTLLALLLWPSVGFAAEAPARADALPLWTMLPFPALVLAIAVMPILLPRFWERRWFQALVVVLCSAPVVAYLLALGRGADLAESAGSFTTFIVTIGALYIAAGGVYATGDLEATPRTNVLLLIVGSALASLIGATGASVLMIRPVLRTNSQRAHTGHLVPFFILAVANAGGLLTPLGGGPLLIGFIEGVPFLWTLRLLPVWLLYVGSFAVGLYVVDRRAYARENAAALGRDRTEVVPLSIRGRRNVFGLTAIIGATFLPSVLRELALVAIGALSYFGTPRELHEKNQFVLAPMIEVALLFAGLFACLVPIESGLAASAPHLPIQRSWQLFWASGSLSAVLDNAPTYAAFAALARGLGTGHAHLVAGIMPIQLAAISAGSVVMGATTYIGNGPNLIMKAIAEQAGYTLPSFGRFAIFAFFAMLPAHLVMTLAFVLLER